MFCLFFLSRFLWSQDYTEWILKNQVCSGQQPAASVLLPLSPAEAEPQTPHPASLIISQIGVERKVGGGDREREGREERELGGGEREGGGEEEEEEEKKERGGGGEEEGEEEDEGNRRRRKNEEEEKEEEAMGEGRDCQHKAILAGGGDPAT